MTFSPEQGIAHGYIDSTVPTHMWPSKYPGQYDASGWDGFLPQNFDAAKGHIVVWAPGPYERFQRPTGGWKDSQHTAMSALIHHSMEGWFRMTENKFVPEYDNPSRESLWHFSVRKDDSTYNPQRKAIIYQHAPAFARTIASSGANFAGPAIELEGLKDHPITDAQIESCLWLHKQLTPHMAPAFRYERNPDAQTGDQLIWGLVEHRQFPTRHGSTACPSERYARLWSRIVAQQASNVLVADPQFEERITALETPVAALRDWQFEHQEKANATQALVAEHDKVIQALRDALNSSS